MKTFVSPGKVIPYVAPSGGISAGAGVVIGSLFGVAAISAVEGATCEVCLEGVFTLPKASGAITQGAKVYWDSTPGEITTTAASNKFAGYAWAAELSAATTVKVLLAARGDTADAS